MAQDQASGANADQITYWNASAGETWAALQDQLDHQIEPLGARAMDALAPAPGERVIDIGCGCGQTTMALAARVGPGGAVLGVDISRPMLEVARRRVAAQGLAQVTLTEADAQTHAFAPGAFDAVFSRFGVMFFADPTAAFANIRGALRPGGRLGFVCWRPFADNPWMMTPMTAALQHLPPLPPPPDPFAPGPFAFADADRLRGILSDAGFEGVRIEPLDALIGAPTLDQAVDVALKVGPLGALLRDQPDKAGLVVDAIRAALAPYVTPDGVRLPSATWIVRASAP
jgi:SAM-dependent methyltransferase